VLTRYIPDPYDPQLQHGFVWSKDTGMMDIGAMEGYPFGIPNAINDRGEIVGAAAKVFSGFSTPLNRHAVIWKNGTAYDLNDNLPVGSEWILNDAWAINARGQIVAQGFSPTTGLVRLFLLDPQPSSAPTPAEE
jgi:uncharacterized membrane protein